MINLSKYKIKKEDYLLVGVSGGSDSMSLLDMLYNAKYKLIVCHVNYHKRDSALRDEKIVEQYCVSHSIKYFKKDCFDSKDNFQDFARDYRYEFFKEIYYKYGCKACLTAHQLNDKLETYLFKKERNSIGRSLSIEEEDYIYGMKIIRPLLNKFYKKDLEKYCASHSIEFGTDESNLQNHYSRNKIRNTKISKLTDLEVNLMVDKMNKECDIWSAHYNTIVSNLIKNTLNLTVLKKMKDIDKHIIICEMINNSCKYYANHMKKGILDNIINKLLNMSSNGVVYQFKHDNKIMILDNKKIISIIDNPIELDEFIIKDFKHLPKQLSKSGDPKNGIYVSKDDFPLVLRSYKNTDVITLKGDKHKHLNRLFIDKKVPIYLRKTIPVLLNAKNEVLLVKDLYRKYSKNSIVNNIFIC